MKLLKLIPILFVAGCAVGPDYTQPDVSLSPDFVGSEVQQSPLKDIAKNTWWNEYNDPILNSIIARGLKQNLDIVSARERIIEAEATLRTKGINAQLAGSPYAEYLRSGGDGITTDNTFTTGLSATFVIDMFGGISRDQEAAIADLDAAQADLEKTRLAWLADLIVAYFNTSYYQKALEYTQDTIKSREGTVSITELQYKAGAATEYDLVKAQALLEAAKADLPNYTASLNANIFSLATLLNEPASELFKELKDTPSEQVIPSVSAYGIPADLLRNRPDVHYYEALLHSAVAEVGVATADMYPSLTLLGDVGLSDGDGTWSFGPQLSIPLLNQGALRANRDVKISSAKQAEIDWRMTISSAVEDVQVAISNFDQYRKQSEALTKSSDYYSKALALAQTNFRNGAITLLDLLDTDRSAASAKISAASAINNTVQEWASLQIAMGAGSKVYE